MKCRLCKGPRLETVVDLGPQALGCRYPEHPDETVPVAPLHLMRCRNCGLGQLSESPAPLDLYRSGYGYRSSQTDTMKRHLERLVENVLRHVNPPGGTWIDIGSNDGTLLSFVPKSMRRIGIDPVAIDHEYPEGVEKFEGLFPDLTLSGIKAKVVTAIAMFYDLDDPVGFLRAIGDILEDEGIAVLEFMYAESMLAGAWDQISHEHVCYHSLSTVMEACRRAQTLEVALFEDVPINGGSLRVVLQKPGIGPIWALKGRAIADRMRIEHGWDWSALDGKVRASVRAIQNFVWEHASYTPRQSVEILGASQRGNTVLQAALTPALVEGIRAAVERDPNKVGRHTPGTMIPIIGEEDRNWADRYVVTPWQFRDEVLEREVQQGAPAGTKYLFALPDPEIVTL